MSMKRVFCILLVVGFLITTTGCIGDYTRVADVCVDSEGNQYLWDEAGEMWEVLDELPVGAVVEITLRDGGNLDAVWDDRVVELRVLQVPAETEPAEETVVAPLD